MSTIQFGGVVSGLNTQGIIDALVAVKKQPLTELQNKEASLTSQKVAYAQLGSALDDLVTKVKNFTVTAAGASRVASSADSSVFTAIVAANTPASQYQVSVDRLATSTRAASTDSLGAAVTGAVDTSLMLSKANLASPVTTGNMAITVDGTTIQFAVGDPTTTSIQTLTDGIASALQAQIVAQGDTATVAASIVGGKLQLSISDNSASHTISFGDVADTSTAAKALGLDTQGVSGVQNATISGGAYLDPVLGSLNLPGAITAGQISAVIDGVVVRYTVGDPSKTTLTQLLDGLSASLQGQLRAGGVNVGADASATVTGSVVANRLQLAVTGAGLAHSISFGAAGDVSNALGVLGIANTKATNATNPTLTGATNLGVVRTNSILDSAGLTGLTATHTGTLTINGVAINYDTAVDSLSSILTRINNSGAGVVASVDRTNDKLMLTRKETGAIALDIRDISGNLGSMLKLAPGTTNAQTIGLTAQVTVDGRSITSTTNTVTNAIDGVTINLAKESPLGLAQTLTVAVDQPAVTAAINSFVSSFNSLGDLLDKLTAATPGQAGGTAGSSGPLSSDPTARALFLSLRETLFATSGSGTINSLGAIGLNTGNVGAAVGTTDRLQLDTTRLAAVLSSDPNQVASLLDGPTGVFSKVLTKLKTLEDPSNTSAFIQAHTAGLGSEITSVQRQEASRQEMIDSYQTMIEAQYAAMESTLALLQAQSSQINAALGISSTTSSGSGLGNSSTK